MGRTRGGRPLGTEGRDRRSGGQRAGAMPGGTRERGSGLRVGYGSWRRCSFRWVAVGAEMVGEGWATVGGIGGL